jgi:hypothetical protein
MVVISAATASAKVGAGGQQVGGVVRASTPRLVSLVGGALVAGHVLGPAVRVRPFGV